MTGCILIAIGALGIVYFAWYPPPLHRISGVGEMLLLVLIADVTLGPVLTFIVFDRRKHSLRFDLACICFMQLAALTYGLYTVEAGRPHYVVFVKDRFEIVSKADLQPGDRAAARGNPAADTNWFGPRIVAAELPSSQKERARILFESALGGRDLQHFPERFREYSSHASLAAANARPLADLRALNPTEHGEVDTAIGRIGMPESRLGFLPIKGLVGDATMLVDASTGTIVEMAALRPWQ
jgi:hypothetical protein